MRTIKLRLRLLQRFFRDYSPFARQNFARPGQWHRLPHQISLKQLIHKNTSHENKLFNLRLAVSKINQVQIQPGQILSFWKVIGNPEKTYKKSRAIINGKLAEDTGGGLCQISGALYHLSLIAGLEITERHNHSIDIYTEETRFTPLGTDATIVYGYKDLRIRNNQNTPIQFHFSIETECLTLSLLSAQPQKEEVLIYLTQEEEKHRIAIIKNTRGETVSRSRYKLL